MLNIPQNTDNGLKLVCWEYVDGVKTALNVEGLTLELKLIHEDDDKVYAFADARFTKSGQLAAIDFTAAETKAFLCGKYKIQLAVTDTGRAIALSNYDLNIQKTY